MEWVVSFFAAVGAFVGVIAVGLVAVMASCIVCVFVDWCLEKIPRKAKSVICLVGKVIGWLALAGLVSLFVLTMVIGMHGKLYP